MKLFFALQLALALLLSPLCFAEIYKCVDDKGQVQFSDRVCSSSAEVIEVEDHTAGISIGPTGDYSKMRSDNKTRDLEAKIRRKESQIKGLEKTRDSKISDIQKQKKRAANNLAGATWETSLATEMQAVSQDYNSRIAAKRDEISRLESKIENLANAPAQPE